MSYKHIITGQKISPELVARAKELRQSMTPTESKLWQCLRGNRLGGYHFRRQQIIEGYIVDFYCHAVGLVVEVDGDIHDQQKDYDQERDEQMRGLDLKILRFSNADVNGDLNNILHIILEECKRREHKYDSS